MEFVKTISNIVDKMFSNNSGVVPGTWDLSSDLSYVGIERYDSTGRCIIDLNPGCRIFISGCEVTKDVISCSITHNLEGSSRCTIKLANPRGRYCISRSDLHKNWREDKDILSAYDYEWIRQRQNLGFDVDNILQKVGGAGLLATVKEASKLVKGTFSTVKSALSGGVPVPSIKGVTRVIFEIKHFSGLTKYVNDCVFDYRDPVYVFMKGRFSNFWYFAFTGMISTISESMVYPQEDVITLECTDILGLLKKQNITERGSILSAGNMEMRFRNASTSRTFDILGSVLQRSGVDVVSKSVLFGPDYALVTESCYLYGQDDKIKASLIGKDKETGDKIKDYKSAKDTLVKSFSFHENFMFTEKREESASKNLTSATSKVIDVARKAGSAVVNFMTGSSGIDPIIDIAKTPMKELNSLTYSPWNLAYFQLNFIPIPSLMSSTDSSSKLMLEHYYNLSTRYWEYAPLLQPPKGKSVVPTSKDMGTGWYDNKCFGVAGIHPALTYEVVNCFDQGQLIWEQCYLGGTKAIDKLVVSPIEKIRESVFGSCVEIRGGADKGTNINLFRPRVFLLLPKRFQIERSPLAGDFGNFSLSVANMITVFDALQKLVGAIEFDLFSSPMGDIFIEPALYDMHPLDFYSKADKDDVTYAQEKVTINSFGEIGKNNKGTENNAMSYTTTAYAYNRKASHPYLFMEKDRISVTMDFKPEYIKTSVSVQAGKTMSGYPPLENTLLQNDEFARTLFALSQSDLSSNRLGMQAYIADGFPPDLYNRLGPAYELKKKQYEKQHMEYYFVQLPLVFFKTYTTEPFSKLVDDTISKLDSYTGDVKGIWAYMDIQLPSIIPDTAIWKVFKKQEKEELVIGTIFPSLFKALEEYAGSSPEGRLFTKRSLIKDICAIDTTKPITSQLAQDFFNRFYNKESDLYTVKINGVPRANIIMDLIKGSEIVLLHNNSDLLDLKKEIVEDYLPKLLQAPVTLGALKDFAKAGLYQPSKDYVRLYGYNSGPQVTNLFIQSGEEALKYAEVIFKRFLGQVYQTTATVIGRPELFLNRPIYLEAKDIIGRLSQYTLEFQIGSTFNSGIQLTYIRKNALTYAYGEEDDFTLVSKSDIVKLRKKEEEYFESIGVTGKGKSGTKLTSLLKSAGKSVLPLAAQAGVAGLIGVVKPTSTTMVPQKGYTKSATSVINGKQYKSIVLATLTSTLEGALGNKIAFRFTRILEPIGTLASPANLGQFYIECTGDLSPVLAISNAIVISSNQTENIKVSCVRNNTTLMLSAPLMYSYQLDELSLVDGLGTHYSIRIEPRSGNTFLVCANTNGVISNLLKKLKLRFSKHQEENVFIKSVASNGIILQEALQDTYIPTSVSPISVTDGNSTSYTVTSTLSQSSRFIPVDLRNSSLPRYLTFILERTQTESFRIGNITGTRVSIIEPSSLKFPHFKSLKDVSYIENELGEKFYLSEDISVTGNNLLYAHTRDLERKLTLVFKEGGFTQTVRVEFVSGNYIRLQEALLHNFTTSAVVSDNQDIPVFYQLALDALTGQRVILLLDVKDLSALTNVTLHSVFKQTVKFNGWSSATSFLIDSPLKDSFDSVTTIVDQEGTTYQLSSTLQLNGVEISLQPSGNYNFLRNATNLTINQDVVEDSTISDVYTSGSDDIIVLTVPLKHKYQANTVVSDFQDIPQTYTLSQDCNPGDKEIKVQSYHDLYNAIHFTLSGKSVEEKVVQSVVYNGTTTQVTLTSSLSSNHPSNSVISRIDATVDVSYADTTVTKRGRITSLENDTTGIIHQTKEAFSGYADVNIREAWKNPSDKTHPVEPYYSTSYIPFSGGVTVPSRRVSNKASVIVGAPLAQLAGSAVKKLLETKVSGGLFSVHPMIGHINYNDSPFTYTSIAAVGASNIESFINVINDLTSTITELKNQYINIGNRSRKDSELYKQEEKSKNLEKDIKEISDKLKNTTSGLQIDEELHRLRLKNAELEGVKSLIIQLKNNKKNIIRKLYGQGHEKRPDNLREVTEDSYFGQLYELAYNFDNSSIWELVENEWDTKKNKLTFDIPEPSEQGKSKKPKQVTVETYLKRTPKPKS